VPAAGPAWLAGYLLAQDRWLAAQDGGTLLAGSVTFAVPAD
jgi:2-keto-4-pentenoate hydratase